jgi:flavin reductase (DIM6/NTAB) family NADH-FMN oxidoreductase RutF
MDDNTVHAEAAGYRVAMRAFATGVAIIACGRGAQRAGCVATAVASLSLDPPSLIVNLQRDGSTYRRLKESDAFSVNFLKSEQEPLAQRFAGGAPSAERFSEGAWIEGATGAPALADALATLDCRIVEILERYTHAIVIGRVAAARSVEGPALLHFRGRFART